MAEITPNLIHVFRESHLHKTKPPFVFGLRTGYVRAWVFVVFKVWLILALINGVTTMNTIEKNIALLDGYVRNDFTGVQALAAESSPALIFEHSKTKVITIPLIVSGEFAPRGPAQVAGAVVNN